jgi:hypothetical protein
MLVAVLALSFLLRAVDSGAGAVPCPGGRFLVHDLPINAPAIVVDDARVSVDSVCPPVVGTSRQSRTGTRVRAAWRSCQLLTGPAGLKATIEGADCDTMTGVFKGRVTLCFDGRCDVQRFRQPFTARRAA